MDKSIKAIIIAFLCAWLFGSCIITKLKAEDVVTGNILPNAVPLKPVDKVKWKNPK